jgi:hypothetical protein
VKFIDHIKDYLVEIEYNINDLLLAASIYRYVFFVRYALSISKYTNPRA